MVKQQQQQTAIFLNKIETILFDLLIPPCRRCREKIVHTCMIPKRHEPCGFRGNIFKI